MKVRYCSEKWVCPASYTTRSVVATCNHKSGYLALIDLQCAFRGDNDAVAAAEELVEWRSLEAQETALLGAAQVSAGVLVTDSVWYTRLEVLLGDGIYNSCMVLVCSSMSYTLANISLKVWTLLKPYCRLTPHAPHTHAQVPTSGTAA